MQSKKTSQMSTQPIQGGVDAEIDADVDRRTTRPQQYDSEMGDIGESDGEADPEIEDGVMNLPSQQHQYILNANSSKFSRKSYYKKLQGNKYEREFCFIMDSKQGVHARMQRLYRVFHEGKLRKERDAIDILQFLQLESEQKEDALEPLKLEIMHLTEDIAPEEVLLQTPVASKRKIQESHVRQPAGAPKPNDHSAPKTTKPTMISPAKQMQEKQSRVGASTNFGASKPHPQPHP